MINCTFTGGHQVSLRHVTVDNIVIKDNKILLVKRSEDMLEGGKYALPGGFLDRDERIPAGALRELLEETGCKGKIISLFRIIGDPYRRGEDRQNVDFVFLVEVGERVSEPDDESSAVEWFDLDKIPDEEQFAFDHFETVQLYLKHKKEDTELPIMDL